jgi:hypothetical protein|tara:strand:+ start:335 stop:751 length:417 start_codon:yes stop_codon:yes gene_type:complete
MPPNIKTIRAKGHAFERELAKFFRDHTGLEVHRTCLTQQFHDRAQGQEDLTGLPHLSIEAKRVEKLDFPGALRQAQANSPPDAIPVVINRRNRQKIEDAYTLIRLEDFIELYLAWLNSTSDPKPKQTAEALRKQAKAK